MNASMSGANHTKSSLRVGVPYRTAKEEAAGSKVRHKIDPYLRMVEQAGAEAVLLSLETPRPKLEEIARALDAFVLPGSPADVDPAWYHAERRPETAAADPAREQMDFTLLDVAFAAQKPVLAICYGLQSLNVYLGGRLVQDIASELDAPLKHDWQKETGEPEPFHALRIEEGSRLAQLRGAAETQVNSSHHQAVDRPGRDLRITARAADGVIEALELEGPAHWVTAVQWHPERMTADALALALFRDLVAAAHRVAV